MASKKRNRSLDRSKLGHSGFAASIFADRPDTQAERDRLRALYWAQVNAAVNSPFTGRPIQSARDRYLKGGQ